MLSFLWRRDEDYTFDDLKGAFSKLYDDYALLLKKNKCLQKDMKIISQERNKFESESLTHKEEVESLKKGSEDLCCIVEKFTNGKENFAKLLGSQKLVFDNCGVGLNQLLSKSFSKIIL